jgi:hypothetical protein
MRLGCPTAAEFCLAGPLFLYVALGSPVGALCREFRVIMILYVVEVGVQYVHICVP